MLALVVGTLLAIAALVVVLQPLFAVGASQRLRPRAAAAAADREDPVLALREIEFDRATGKLSDSDYDALKSEFTRQALAAMRADDATAARSGGDAAEDAVLAYRRRAISCASCGPRPEPDAIYCSSCGGYLPGKCASCATPVLEPGAQYCTGCGTALAA